MRSLKEINRDIEAVIGVRHGQHRRLWFRDGAAALAMARRLNRWRVPMAITWIILSEGAAAAELVER